MAGHDVTVQQTTIGLPNRIALGASSPPPHVPDFCLTRIIGRGSFGTVWLAEETVAGVYRAVKVLDGGARRDAIEPPAILACGDSSAAPAARGASAFVECELAGLHVFQIRAQDHPHLIQIYKSGLSNDGASAALRQTVYYVMDVADHAGGARPHLPADYEPLSLAVLLRRDGRLSPSRVLEYARQMLSAIEYLHRHGIHHRDIKPANVLFVRAELKLADIGLVSTDTHEAVGTTAYLPPEGKPDDCYALGKVIYEMTTGLPADRFPEWPADLDPVGDRLLPPLRKVFTQLCHPDRPQRLADPAAIRRGLDAILAEPRLIRLSRPRAAVWTAGVAALAFAAGLGTMWLSRAPMHPYLIRTARAPYDGAENRQEMQWADKLLLLNRRHWPGKDLTISETGTFVRLWDVQTRLTDANNTPRLEVHGKFQIFNDNNPLRDDIEHWSGEVNQIYVIAGTQYRLLYHGQQGREPGTFGVFGRSIPLQELVPDGEGDIVIEISLTAAGTPQGAERDHLKGQVGPISTVQVARLRYVPLDVPADRK